MKRTSKQSIKSKNQEVASSCKETGEREIIPRTLEC
jgi:hypothetical protein